MADHYDIVWSAEFPRPWRISFDNYPVGPDHFSHAIVDAEGKVIVLLDPGVYSVSCQLDGAKKIIEAANTPILY
jgi:hypothetical protein